MRKNIASVIDAFHAGEAYQDRTVRTDGRVIWSYGLPIAARMSTGTVIVLAADGATSRTTAAHIRAVQKALPDAHVSLDPAFRFDPALPGALTRIQQELH